MPPPKLSELLQQLIAIPSISCTDPVIDQGNLAVIEQLVDWFDALGFATEIQLVDAEHNKANLIATIGSGNEGLVLAGHTDTVPYDANRWQFDPFNLTEDNQRYYGLGTADMKSFFALVIEAIRELDPGVLKQPLIILATADEETSMSGAKALTAKHLPNARHAVIGEPTSLKPIRMHKGMMMESIQLTGLAGHSSNPDLGNSALEAMHRVMSELLKWRDELQQAYNNPLFNVPIPTMNLGHIHGGDNPNRICGHCELQIDIRPLPGMKLDELRYEIDQRLSRTLAGSGISYQTQTLFDGIEAMETAATTPIVKTVEKLTASDAEAAAYATEAPYLNNIGIDTIVLGPGHIQQAHQPDEYLALKQINPMVDILKGLIREFCL
jgi:acetylornithine deacetylase